MKLIIFSLVFLILVAFDSVAIGLEITEIDFSVDYDDAYTYRLESRDRKDSGSVSIANNSKIDADLFPGSNITFTVRVENTFQSQGPNLRGVFVTMTIEDIDDGADIDEQSLNFDLEPGDDERVDIKFIVPVNVDAGTYNVLVEAEGEDRNDTLHKKELKLKLEVKKQSHDIRITKVFLSPSVIDCDRKSKLTAEIINLGSNPENQVALEFKSNNLGINSFDKDIALESSDEASDEEKTHTKTLSIEVPSFLRAGTYPIFINLYWKNFVLFDQKTADLVVRDCVSSKVSDTETEDEQKEEVESNKEALSVINSKVKPKGPASIPDIVTATEETSLLNSPLLLILIGFIILLVLVILIVYGFWKNK